MITVSATDYLVMGDFNYREIDCDLGAISGPLN